MIDHAFAADFAREWIAAWNSHDLERIFAHYTDDFSMSSPLIVQRGFDPSGTTVVTGSMDGSVRLWDALPQGTLAPIDTRPSPVQALWAGDRPVSVEGRRVRILTTSGRVLRQLTMPAPISSEAG